MALKILLLLCLVWWVNSNESVNSNAGLNKTESSITEPSDNETSTLNTLPQQENGNSEQMRLKEIYDTLEFVQDVYLIPFICTIGIAGNGILASYMFGNRGSNSSFIYMFAVLVADLLSLVADLFLFVATLMSMNDSDRVRQIAANIYFWNKNFLSYVLRTTAFNTLCVLSAERLMAIRYPLKLKSSITVKRPQIFLFLALVVGIVTNIQIPLFTEIGGIYDAEKNQTVYKRVYSDLYFKDKQTHDTVVLVLHFFSGPIQILFFCVMNMLIIHGMYQNRKNLLAMNMNNVDRLKSMKNLQDKLSKIFLVLCLTNILAFLPNSLTTIIAKLFPELGMNIRDYSTQILLHGGNFLRILNSASDFIVMLAMSDEIRREVLKKIRCISSSSMYLDKEQLSSSKASQGTGFSSVSSINGRSDKVKAVY